MVKIKSLVLNGFLDLKKTTKIKAHQSALSFLELSPSGSKLASSSEKVIFIFEKMYSKKNLGNSHKNS